MKIHIVKQGDTLYELSKKYGVPLDKVIEANPQIANPDVLAIGDKVKIPSVPVPVPDGGELYHKHTVKQGDTLWKLSKAWGIQLKDIIEANPQLKNPDVLKIGDIVNIPKKATVPSAHPAQPVQPAQPIQQEHATTSVSDKTTPGGKAYTGPIEKAKETAPVVPAPAPVPEPAPIPAPAPPVQETVHTETQSLFVQISVPAQEAAPLPPAPEPPKEYCIPEPPKNYCGCEPVTPCDKSYGYPGITENPNYYDCPPVYPMYEAVQPLSYAPCEVQPIAHMPEIPSPYCYPDAGYPAMGAPAPYYPGVTPGYMAEMPAADFQPYSETPAYASPQYGVQPAPLPWPSCGCGGSPGIQPYPFGQEAPFYGTAFPQPYSAAPSYPAAAYSSPATTGIPPVPKFPGTEDWVYSNRLPVETEAVPAAGASFGEEGVAGGELTGEQNNIEDQGEVKTSSLSSEAKAKTSSRRGKEIKTSGTTKQQRSGKGKETVKKRRNPWISD